jgi:predicted acylesterase/phospholipase RssA
LKLFQKNTTTARSLILAGGGVRLAYHAGVLKALEESVLTFNHVAGTSGGIFGTAMMAAGITPADACRRWRQLKLRGFLGILPFKNYNWHGALRLFNGAEGIKKAIFPALGIDIGLINANTRFDASFNVCNFSKKTVESVTHQVVTINHLVAGLSLPMFIPATKIGTDWYTDAVWIKDANLTMAVKRGAQEILLVWCIGNTPEYRHGRFKEYVHMIEISANAALSQEIEWINNENLQRKKTGIKEIAVHIIKPAYPLPLDPAFFVKHIDADTLINMGYADTKTCLQHYTAIDLNEVSGLTAMKSCEATLHFRQQFTGMAMLNGIQQHVCIRLAFFVRRTKDMHTIEQFSSMMLQSGSETISGFNNTIVKSGRGRLSCCFNIEHHGSLVSVQAVIQLSSVSGFLFGIDNKWASVTIPEGGCESKERKYFQPFLNRVKNALHVNVEGNFSGLKKWKQKRSIINYLLL